MPILSYRDLLVWQKSYELAMDIFSLSRRFPKEELYSLTSQLVRSSRSVSANIAEGWAKREFENLFKRHLIDAIGSNVETGNWLLFAKDCQYITEQDFLNFYDRMEEVSKMLTKLHQKWTTY